jgi:hypothetical protein
MVYPTIEEVWADFNADGSVKEPAKEEIRRLMRIIQAIALASGMKTYPNKAAMNADTTQDDGKPALLWADPVEANNYPTVWVWNDGPNQWIAGLDRITPLQLVLNVLAAAIIPNSKLSVGGVDLIQRFSTPTSAGQRVPAGITDDFFLALFKGLKIIGDGGATLAKSVDPNVLLSVKGTNGRILMQLHADPSKTFGPWAKSSTTITTNPLGADIVHIIIYGQSLGEGAEALPVVSTSDTGHNGKRFVRGVRTFRLDTYANNPTGRPATDFDLVPLIEVQNGGAGETSATGMVATLKEYLCGPNSPIARNGTPEILVTFAGLGGRILDELKKTPIQPDPQGKYYDTTIDDVRRAKAYANEKQKSYAVAGIIWWQGEANNSLQRVRGGPILSYPDAVNFYRDDLIQLADDLHSDIVGITQQRGRIPFWTYQTVGTGSGQAQLNAADKAPHKIFPLGPTWHVPSAINSRYTSGGNLAQPSDVHITADGEAWAGSNYGKAIYRHLVGREQTLALRCVGAMWVDDTTVELLFNVPRPPIRLDTVFWPARGADLGFKVMYGSMIKGDVPGPGGTYTNGPAISSVSLVDPARIRLKLAAARDSTKLATIAFGTDRIAATLAGGVVAWRDGAALPNGLASKELEIGGAIPSVVTQLLNEGAFYVQNQTKATPKAWIARSVSLVGGNTVLLGAARDVSSGVSAPAFEPGNAVNVARVQAYGNVFDSDTAVSPLTFRDTAYGTRQGQNYPLGNPLLSFQDLEVK